ncbi:MAG: alpha-galactosidase [Verrucomicrobia bacterium]|nr:MAG: alpha-galactosidase [Verrucomicrobiota bacterium]
MNPTTPQTERRSATRLRTTSCVVLAIGLLCPLLPADEPAAEKKAPLIAPQLSGGGLEVRYKLEGRKLRELSVLPAGMTNKPVKAVGDVEVELQVTGLNWAGHHAKKLIAGNPGTQLIYLGQHTLESKLGRHEMLLQRAPDLGLRVESHYEFFQDIPVMRRWTRVVNESQTPVGLEHVSSAMVYNFANFGASPLEQKLRIHYANNSWKSEAQWQTAAPSRWGFLENGLFSLTAIAFNNIGSWSTMSQLPIGMAENRDLGVMWCWQIEHNGSWHWEISETTSRTSYLYLGGPDELFSQAWKQLQPGQSYVSVPVAVGCVKGGFDEAVAAMTAYRRKACLMPHEDNVKCPVIFNDYMNCLNADPTAEKETPVIAAAAAAGCEYFVIDAGWYAERSEKWWESVGLWQPSKTRFGPNGLMGVLDQIRAKGMVPGLWLEIEVAGINSPLKDKPDSWFFMRHGKRVIASGRYLLDYRNPEVRAHADEVINRLVRDYRVGYIKMDYNVDALLGTETQADSFGQGLLEHQRAYLAWTDAVHQRFPNLVIENCSSGGGRMDYGMLSRHQLQSSSDQDDYRKYPTIVAGGLAAVLPEQFAVWSYPKAEDDADAASFNMVNAMLARIHQSGGIANLKDESRQQVHTGIRIYKEHIRPYIPQLTPFYPLGQPPSMADTTAPVAVGLRNAERALVAVWRLAGAESVALPNTLDGRVSLLYPTDLGIKLESSNQSVVVKFPRPYMAAILEITK